MVYLVTGDWSQSIYSTDLINSAHDRCVKLAWCLKYGFWYSIYSVVVKYSKILDPVVQSVVSLTSSLRVISLTVLADSIYNILIFFAEKCDYSHFFSKIFQHICISLDVNFNKSLTNDVVSFEQLGPVYCWEKSIIQVANPKPMSHTRTRLLHMLRRHMQES